MTIPPPDATMTADTETQTGVRPPRMYVVVMLNDDFTPMPFVVAVLMQVFGLPFEQAKTVMLAVHHEGRAAVGVYTRDVAASKINKAHDWANKEGHPFLCLLEPA